MESGDQVPRRLETERLVLRLFRQDDWPEIHEYYADAEAMRYTTGRALSEGESWRAMAGAVGHWELHGYGPYALEERASGRVIGVVGFWYPIDWPEPEIKWGLKRTYHGRGLASEATRAVLAAGKRHLPQVRWISMIDVDNEPSIRLALAVGATPERELEFRGTPCRVYRHS